MNCVNCGAPPKRGASECAYCETPLERKEPRANYAGFRRAVASFESDFYRSAAVSTLRGNFTAGQVRAILAEFDEDFYRQAAAARLVPVTLNPAGLFDAATLFGEDFYRSAFVALLGSTTDGLGDVDDDPPTPPPERPRSAPVSAPARVWSPWSVLTGIVLGLTLMALWSLLRP